MRGRQALFLREGIYSAEMRSGHVVGRQGFLVHIHDDHEVVAVGAIRIGKLEIHAVHADWGSYPI